MRRSFLWIQLVAAALVAIGVWLQVYFIASYFFGEEDALELHQNVGGALHGIEILVFLAALGAWWRNWGKIGHAFGLAVVGTVQIGLTDGEGWVGGLHGLLALALLTMAVFIVKDDAEALGLTRSSRGDAGDTAPPRPLP
jgi:hypothetical protein